MKPLKFYSIVILAFLMLVHFSSCTKDEEPMEEQIEEPIPEEVEILPGLDIDSIPTDRGSIGISINTRVLARKGYKPAAVSVLVAANSGDFDTNLPIDQITNMATLKYAVDDLTEAQLQELRNGVTVTLDVKDGSGNTLMNEVYTATSFTASPIDIEVDSESLPDLLTEVALREDVSYYIQIVEGERTNIFGVPINDAYADEENFSRDVQIRELGEIDYNTIDLETVRYYFENVPNTPGKVAIYGMDGDNKHYIYVWENTLRIQTKRNLIQNGGNTEVENYPNYHFEIVKEGLGLYSIYSDFFGTNLSLVDLGTEDERYKIQTNTGTDQTFFRILNFDIDWQMQVLDSKFLQPILPASETASAFNSTLKNCSAGELVQTVGNATTVSSTSTVGWEESLSVSTTQEISVSVSIGMEVETSFFGAGATASASVSSTYSASNTRETTSTQWMEESETEEITVSTERTITVPPGSATQVSDLYQTYENIRIPFVQRFRIKGRHQSNNQPLSGIEITTQFAFNSFTGVITEVGPDYIDVTVRGTNVINRLIDTQTTADDIPADCD